MRSSAEESHQTKGLLRLTWACNERCPFCNVPMEEGPERPPDDQALRREIDRFAAAGERTLTISGGEPTLLRRRLRGLIRHARAQGIPFVELQTNAVLIDEAYAAELKAAGLTSAFVSLLSDQPPLHDALAGLEGAFPRCLRGLDAMAAQGLRLTLNPVIAASTQHRVAEYVDFVAARLPAVSGISLSAVQPHGRARDRPELLPNYAVLAGQIPRARARAAAHGIELLNPYCGLPLCVGWAADEAHSVEAIEAAQGGWRPRPGLDNRGDKVHGQPCATCAQRTRCGGAWRAYWTHHGGAGLAPPLHSAPPWAPIPADPSGQTTVHTPAAPEESTWKDLAAADTPTVWLHCAALERGHAGRLMRGHCTDVAISLDCSGAQQSPPPQLARTLQQIRRLCAANRIAQPQTQLRVWLELHTTGQPGDVQEIATWATRTGVFHVSIRPVG